MDDLGAKTTFSRINPFSSKHRVRKETKNGMMRLLPMDDELFGLLSSLYSKQGKEELVFPSPTGKAIDDKNIRDRVWKRVLEGLKIPYRVPYAGRHSMISRAIEQGVPLTGVAYLIDFIGNKVEYKVGKYGNLPCSVTAKSNPNPASSKA